MNELEYALKVAESDLRAAELLLKQTYAKIAALKSTIDHLTCSLKHMQEVEKEQEAAGHGTCY